MTFEEARYAYEKGGFYEQALELHRLAKEDGIPMPSLLKMDKEAQCLPG